MKSYRQNLSLVKNHLFFPIFNLSSNLFLITCSSQSTLTTSLRSTSSVYLIGMRCWQFTSLMNAFTLDFFVESLRTTMFGYFLIPATNQWPQCRSRVRSSKLRTITAFRPANRHCRTITALLGLMNSRTEPLRGWFIVGSIEPSTYNFSIIINKYN